MKKPQSKKTAMWVVVVVVDNLYWILDSFVVWTLGVQQLYY